MAKVLMAAVSALGVAALAPAAASAQGYYGSGYGGYGYSEYDACDNVRGGRQAAGALVGGIIGGLIGNGVAADNASDSGTAVGAVLGAVAGGAIAGNSVECSYDDHADRGGYGYASYPSQDYRSHRRAAPYRTSGGYGYGDDRGYRPIRDEDLYGDPAYGGGYTSSRSSSPAARECETVYRITKLPDGKEIHEPVEACREAYYGDWGVRN